MATRAVDYGIDFLPPGIFEKHSDVPPLAFKELNDAIASLPKCGGKRVYQRALEEASDLVLIESDPHWFWNESHQQPAEAARRLIAYWKKRCSLLGEVNVLQPVTTFQKELNFLPPGIFEKHPSEDPLDFKGLNDAIAVFPNSNSKNIYLKALATVPGLVLLESDPLRYLQSNSFDFGNAAKHLLRYWKKRHDLFGDDDAFKPMTFYNGALNDADREHVRRGNMVFTRVSPGIVPVSMLDSSRIESTSRLTVMRGSFYHMQFGSDLVDAKKGCGGILLARMADSVNAMVDPKLSKKTREVSFEKNHMFLSCFTVRMDHMIVFDTRTKPGVFAAGFTNLMWILFSKLFELMRNEIRLYGRRTSSEACEEIQTFGIKAHAIPASLGGTFEYSRYEAFLEARVEYERQLHCPVDEKASHATQHGADYVHQLIRRQKCLYFEVFEIEANIKNLSEEEQACYQAAKQNALAACWDHECRLLAFLQVEDGNARLAAERIIRYWQLRANVFEGLQYQTMSQTGEDALGPPELQALDNGFVYLLPKDKNGRPVLEIDSEQNIDTVTRRRCLFYMFSVLCEDPVVRFKGAIVVYKLGHSCRPVEDDMLFLEKLGESLAIKIQRLRQVLQNGTPVEEMQSRGTGSSETEFDGTSGQNECVESNGTVTGAGSSSGIPTEGSEYQWARGQRLLWLEVRTRIEFGLPPALDQNLDARFPWFGKRSLLPADDPAERQRRLDLIHVRFGNLTSTTGD